MNANSLNVLKTGPNIKIGWFKFLFYFWYKILINMANEGEF